MDILEAIETRSSVRAYLDQSVDRAVLNRLFSAVARAPSDKNSQMWEIAVIEGELKQKLSQSLLHAFESKQPSQPDYSETEFVGKYKDRAIACGAALYGALGIQREDKIARIAQWKRNYDFFGAPVALAFFLPAEAKEDAWTDIGMLIGQIMLAAQAFGLATCSMRSIAHYPSIVKAILGEEYQSKKLVTAMALGYPNREAPVNQYRTERIEVDEFVKYYA